MADVEVNFLSLVFDLIEKEDYSTLKQIVNRDSSVGDIQDEAMNIVPKLFYTLSSKDNDATGFPHISSLIKTITGIASPKESLLLLLEQLEDCRSVNILALLFHCLYEVLLTLPTSKVKQQELVLSSLISKLMLVTVDDKGDVSDIYMKELVKETASLINKLVSVGNFTSDQSEGYRKLLLHFILRMFQYPLSVISQSSDHIGHSLAADVCRLVSAISTGDTAAAAGLPKVGSGYVVEDWGNVEPTALISFYYYVATSPAAQDVSGIHGMQMTAADITNLLYIVLSSYKHTTSADAVPYGVAYKCVTLCHHVWDHDKPSADGDGRLDEDGVNSCKLHEIPRLLLDNILSTCHSSKLGRPTVRCVKLVISILPPVVAYSVLSGLLKDTEHVGIKTLLINCVKDYIDSSLKSPGSVLHPVFTADSLHKLIHSFLTMPTESIGVEQFLQLSDVTMSALNFLRYLVRRDGVAQNRTGIWDYVDDIEREYLEAVYTQANLCRAECVRVMEGGVGSECAVAVTLLQGEIEPCSERVQEYREAIQSAIHTTDLILATRAHITDYIYNVRRHH